LKPPTRTPINGLITLLITVFFDPPRRILFVERILEAKEVSKEKGRKRRVFLAGVSGGEGLSRCWFQIFFIFTPTWGNDPN